MEHRHGILSCLVLAVGSLPYYPVRVRRGFGGKCAARSWLMAVAGR